MFTSQEEWIEAVNKLADEMLGFEIIMEDREMDDPYDLNTIVDDIDFYDVTPEAFVREHFEEDLASIDYDSYLREEAEEWEAQESTADY